MLSGLSGQQGRHMSVASIYNLGRPYCNTLLQFLSKLFLAAFFLLLFLNANELQLPARAMAAADVRAPDSIQNRVAQLPKDKGQSGHWCGHDRAMQNMRSPQTGMIGIQQIHVPLKKVPMSKVDIPTDREAISQEVQVWEDLRVVFYTDYILHDKSQRSCYAVGDTYRVGNPPPGRFCTGNVDTDCFATCTNEMVIEPGMRDHIVQNIVNWCREEFSRMLKVRPVRGNLVLMDGTCGSEGGVEIPHEHTSHGVPNADLILYVTARPTHPGVLGWAVPCQEIQGNGRAIAGQVNISPLILNDERFGLDFQRGIFMHEIMHVLGFSSSRYGMFVDSNEQRIGLDRVREMYTREHSDSNGNMFRQTYSRIITPRVREMVQEHFACSSARGLPLEEFGGDGTAGSHWEKSAVMDDIMIGAASWFNPGANFVVSKFTLALFEDSGWYKPNYSYSDPRQSKWGLGSGCSILEQRCEDWNLDMDGYFCTERGQNQCTYNLRSKGYCGRFTFVNRMGYYEHIPTSPRDGGPDMYLGYCPLVYAYSNAHCDVEDVHDGVRQFGEYYGPNSACFDSNIVDSSDREVDQDVRCLEYRCTETNLEVRVGDKWIECPQSQERQKITNDHLPDGFKGYVTCPKNGFDILCSRQVVRAQGATGPRSIVDKMFPGSVDQCFFFGIVCVSAAHAVHALSNVALIVATGASILAAAFAFL